MGLGYLANSSGELVDQDHVWIRTMTRKYRGRAILRDNFPPAES
jgi:hypothetical protein